RGLGGVRKPVLVAAAADPGDRAPVSRGLRARRRPAPSGGRRRRHFDGAADRHRLSGAAGRESAADPDRSRRTGLLRRRVRSRRGVRRARGAPGAVAVGALGAPGSPCVRALPAEPAGPPGLRQGMNTDARNRQTLKVLLTIVGALVVAAFLVGIRW